MDPIFATVVFGFFSLIIALTAIAIAIAYRQTDVAKEAVKISSQLAGKKSDDRTSEES
ncbi:MAG: hypothetical protein DHS20C20_30910 [Ardenticatenaceae bacterium]|nr:MAG: hypothetical protein DHS20C20_30910 [Ardenticatenaceae bacterium]